MSSRSRARRRNGRRDLRLEPLESRQLLSLSAQLDLRTGQLRIEGTSQADVVRVEFGQKVEVSAGVARSSIDATTVRVRIQAENSGQVLEKAFRADAVKSIQFDGKGGDDYLANTTGIAATSTTKANGVVRTGLPAIATGQATPAFDAGTFVVDASGRVEVDYLRDAIPQAGEIAIFSLKGMDGLKPGSADFLREAARRALTDSTLGHVVASDFFESARELGKGVKAEAAYRGIEAFAMAPGDTFAILYVTRSSVWDLYNSPDGAARQLAGFSIDAANRDGVARVVTLGVDPAFPGSRLLGFAETGPNSADRDAVIRLWGARPATTAPALPAPEAAPLPAAPPSSEPAPTTRVVEVATPTVTGPLAPTREVLLPTAEEAVARFVEPLPETAVLRGLVYQDANADGRIDPNELALSGIVVVLTGTDTLGSPVGRKVVSGPGGLFVFDGLPAGTYRLSTDDPRGATFEGRGQADGLPGQADQGGVFKIVVNADELANGYALGRIKPASVAGAVFADLDRDRVFDPGEKGIGGVVVTLTGTDDLGQAVKVVTKTGGDGRYEFRGLRPGTYEVRETQPEGWVDGRQSLGTFQGQPRAIDRNGTIEGDAFTGIVLRAGESALNYLFGEWDRLPVAADASARTPDGPVKVVALKGTAGADRIEAVLGAKVHQFWVNGVLTEVDATVPILVAFDGRGGDDVAVIMGRDSAETFTFKAGTTTVVGDGFRLELDRVGDVRFAGGPGDRAFLYDSPGDDVFKAGTTAQTFAGEGFQVELKGVERVYAYAHAGGSDRASFRDSAGDDVFIGTPTESRAYGAGYYLVARGFGAVSAESTGLGYDRGYLYDSAGDDVYRAGPALATLEGPGYSLAVSGYDRVIAYAGSGGLDVAVFQGSAGDDRFDVNPQEAALSGPGFDNRAVGFAVSVAEASAGYDRAYITASAGDDLLRATPAEARLQGPGYDTTARGFPWVRVIGSFGTVSNDRAQLTGSTGNDVLEAEPDFVRFTGSGWLIRVEGFSVVETFGNGGNDRATFRDSVGDDLFEGSPGYGRLTGRWYDNRAFGFRTIAVDASRGGFDRAALTAKKGDEVLTASLAQLSLAGADGSISLAAFESVAAEAAAGGKNRKAIGSGLRFALDLRGDWGA